MIQQIANYVVVNWRELVRPAALFAAVLVAGWLFHRIVFARLRRWAASTKTRLDDILIDSLHGPFLLWILILAIHLATEYSDLPRGVTRWSGKLLLALWIISLTMVLARLSRRMIRVYTSKLEGVLPVGTLTQVLAGLIIGIIGCLTLLQQVFEVDIRAILAALGVGGLAVALALQDTLSNLFAGFYVSVARQIRIGDFIKIDAGQSGYVQDIGWRSTTLEETGGNMIFVPNNKLSQSIVTNYYLPKPRMAVSITVPAAYNSDPARVERILNEIATTSLGQIPGLLDDPAPSVRLIPGFGETSMDFTVVCHVAEYADQFLVQHEIRKRIAIRFQGENIAFRSQPGQQIKP
jgi:small-conductance mechanosensitive channel